MMITANLVKELREKTGAGMLDCKKALEATSGNIEEATDWLREKGISTAAKKEGRIAAEGLVHIVYNDKKASIVELNSETDFVASNEEFIDLVKRTANLVLDNDINTVDEALTLKIDDVTLNDLIISKIAKIGEKLSFRRFESIELNDNEVFGIYIHNTKKIAVIIVLEGANEEVAKDIAMHAAAMRPKHIRKEDVSVEEIEKEREIQKQLAINEGKPADIAEKMVEGRINKHFKEICLEGQEFIKNNDLTVLEYVKNNNGIIKKMVRYEVGEGMEKRCDNFAEEVMNQIKR
ncbi:MAG: translation elongation factor Ts [Bacilli bacterium]|nr:translation elongation factor Ts [Bacilli bacterium]